MDRPTRYRLIAAAAVLIMLALTVVMLVTTRLRYQPADGSTWPPQPDTTALLLADEYVEVEPVIPPMPGGGNDEGAAPPPPEAQDLVNSGPVAETPAPINTSTQPSPVKVPPVKIDKPSGPETSDTPEAKPQEAPKPDVAKEFADRWGKGTQKGAVGTGESNDGPGAGSGTGTGTSRGHGKGKLGGRKIEVNRDVVKSNCTGTVTVRITANPQGKVLKAEAINSGGQPQGVVDECVRRARAARVTPKTDAAAEEIGTITFNIRPE